jgi:hypothetical protein
VAGERGLSDVTAGMSAERVARNDAIFRGANDRIGSVAEELGARGPIPFVCECADPGCRTVVRLSIDEYQSIRRDPTLFINAVGHEESAAAHGELVARADGHVVVRKVGEAGRIAAALEGAEDPATAPVDGAGASPR